MFLGVAITIKGEKTLQGMIIKDAIQKLLLTTPMKYTELMLYFNVEPQTMKNYLTSLKLQNLIEFYPGDLKNHISNRRYIAKPNMPTFSELIEEAWNKRKQGAALARAKRNAVTEKAESKPYIKVVSSDDYHTKGNQHKQCSWVGTTFGTMEY